MPPRALCLVHSHQLSLRSLPARPGPLPRRDGSYITADGNVCVVRSNFTGSVTVSTDSEGRRTVREVGRRVIKEEVKKEVAEDPPALPPFTSFMRGPRTPPPPRPPLPVGASGGSPWLSTRNPPLQETWDAGPPGSPTSLPGNRGDRDASESSSSL